MWVYFLFIKFSMFYYFNNILFKVVYAMLHSFNDTLLMSYCWLAFNALFLGDIVFHVVLSNAVL